MTILERPMLEAINRLQPGLEMNLVIAHEIFGFQLRQGNNGRYVYNSQGYWRYLRDYSGGYKNEYWDIVEKVRSISKIFTMKEMEKGFMVSFSDPPLEWEVFGSNLRDVICKAGLLYMRSLQLPRKAQEGAIRVIGDL